MSKPPATLKGIQYAISPGRTRGGTYFFTVNLAERNKTLLVDHIDILRDAIKLRSFVIPAKAGIHLNVNDSFTMDTGLRRYDDI